MSDNVVPITRAPSAAAGNIHCHRCGGQWWRIIRRAGAGDVISGGVLLAATDQGDRIVGYSGYFECIDCGATR